METNRFAIFTRLMGGEVPPRLPTPPQASHDTTHHTGEAKTDANAEITSQPLTDAFGNLHVRDLDDYLPSTATTAFPLPAYKNQRKQPAHPVRAAEHDLTERDFLLDPRKGEASLQGESFCSFVAFGKFPYK